MELAMKEGTTVEQAMESMTTPSNQQNKTDFQSIENENRETVSDLNQFREQMSQASKQSNQMVEKAKNTMGQMPSDNKGMDMNALKAAQNIARISHEKGTTVDISDLMKQAMGKGSNSSSSKGGTKMGTPSKGSDGKGQGMDMNGQAAQAMQGGGEGELGGDSKRNKAQGGSKMTASIKTSKISVDTNKIKAEALPGRKFSRSSKRRGWLYLDTWYVIGPWENNGQIKYENIHPPEYEIDFSKTYTDGKSKDRGGVPRELKWEFTQSSSMKVIPPEEVGDSTYYAYTEVFFDEEQTMLLAIATDDAAKVWINDIQVWEDQGLSAWSLDEGFRKVFFKQGFNKVLIRIENGPTLCNFSVVICPTTSD